MVYVCFFIHSAGFKSCTMNKKANVFIFVYTIIVYRCYKHFYKKISLHIKKLLIYHNVDKNT